MTEYFSRDNYTDSEYRHEAVHDALPPSWWTPGRIVGFIVGLSAASIIFAFTVFIYHSPQDGPLWDLQRKLFSGHAEQIAIRTVATELKQAQNVLNGDPIGPEQLTEARSLLNQSKGHLDDVSSISSKSALQSLYLQLTQSILQKTPADALRLPPLPGDPATDQSIDAQSLPTAWAALNFDQSIRYLGEPDPAWPAPAPAPETPNIAAISTGADIASNIAAAALPNAVIGGEQITTNTWNNFGLSGYNSYGYDVLGYDRWGYDLWGYDRWGYDKYGYNWYGYDLAGYDRSGWDREGLNIWGQRRGYPDDPTRQDWYDKHQAFQTFYKQKFVNDNPTFSRSLWYKNHGFDPAQYRDWNSAGEWNTPFERDWAKVSMGTQQNESNPNNLVNDHPPVNLSVSLEQFIQLNPRDGVDNDALTKLSSTSAEDFADQIIRRGKTQEKTSTPSSQPDNSQTGASIPTDKSAPHTSSQRTQEKKRVPELGAAPPPPPPSLVSKDFKIPSITKRQTSSPSSTIEKSEEDPASSSHQTSDTETPTPHTTTKPG